MSAVTNEHADVAGLPDFLTPKEAAQVLRVSLRTMRRWIASKLIPVLQPNPARGGHQRIAKRDLVNLFGTNN